MSESKKMCGKVCRPLPVIHSLLKVIRLCIWSVLVRMSWVMDGLPDRSRVDSEVASWNTTLLSTTRVPVLDTDDALPLPSFWESPLFAVSLRKRRESPLLLVVSVVSLEVTPGMLESVSCLRRCSPSRDLVSMDLMGLPSKLLGRFLIQSLKFIIIIQAKQYYTISEYVKRKVFVRNFGITLMNVSS